MEQIDWTKLQTILVPKVKKDEVKPKSPLESFLESEFKKNRVKTLLLVPTLDMIPEINSALPANLDQNQNAPEEETPVRPCFQKNKNFFEPKPENVLEIPEKLESDSRSEASMGNYSNCDSQSNRTSQTKKEFLAPKSDQKTIQQQNSIKSLNRQMTIGTSKIPNNKLTKNPQNVNILKELKKEVKMNPLMYPQSQKKWHEAEYKNKKKTINMNLNTKVIFTKTKLVPKRFESDKISNYTPNSGRGSEDSFQQSQDSKEKETGQDNMFDFEKIKNKIESLAWDIKEQKKLNRVYSAITDNAYQYACSQTNTGKKVEPEPQQTVESLAQLLFKTATFQEKFLQLSFGPSTNKKKIQEGNEKGSWQQVTKGLQDELQTLTDQLKTINAQGITSSIKVNAFDVKLTELKNTMNQELFTSQAIDKDFKFNLEKTLKNQSIINEGYEKRIDETETNFKNLKKTVEQNFETNDKFFSTKASLDTAIQEVFRWCENQLQSCSKRSQCNNDFIVVKEFKALYRKDESQRNTLINECKHLLEQYGSQLKDFLTLKEAEKMQQKLDSVITIKDLEKFSQDSVRRLENIQLQQDNFVNKFVQYSQVIEHYDEVITQKANKISVEQVRQDLVKQFDKKIEKLSTLILQAKQQSEDTLASIVKLPQQAQSMVKDAVEEMQKEQMRDNKNMDQLFQEFKKAQQKEMDKFNQKKVDQSHFEQEQATIQQLSSQLKHSVVMLHESIALHQFKADETKQGKNTKVTQLLEQIQSLQTWVMNSPKESDYLRSSLVSIRKGSPPRKEMSFRKTKASLILSLDQDTIKDNDTILSGQIELKDTLLSPGKKSGTQIHRLNPIVRRLGSKKASMMQDQFPQDTVFDNFSNAGNITER